MIEKLVEFNVPIPLTPSLEGRYPKINSGVLCVIIEEVKIGRRGTKLYRIYVNGGKSFTIPSNCFKML